MTIISICESLMALETYIKKLKKYRDWVWKKKCFTASMKRWRILLASLLLFSLSDVSSSLWPHGLHHARLFCPSPSPGACSNSCPLSQWCHPTISSSLVPFSSCLQSVPASVSFLMSRLKLIWKRMQMCLG